jgi:GTP-binding protein
MKPLVAIIGRPNVGKSTLFNRILNKRYAIVEDTPGVTRDRNFGEAEWCGKFFTLIDTGGYTTSKNVVDSAILEQTLIALEEADILIFMTDFQTGLTTVDLEIARRLKKTLNHKPIIHVINKVDNIKLQMEAERQRTLGLGEPFFISAMDGSGVAEVLDYVLELFPEQALIDQEEEESIKLAIIGRPNAGKSSFVNAILGHNRQIVSEMPGTTRDAVDTQFTRNKQLYTIIDTAGLRRKARIKDNIELFSTLRTEKAIERADIAIILIDAEQGIEHQDMRIINLAVEKKRGIVLAVNKWDLIEKDAKTAKKFEEDLRDNLKNLSYVPIIFISALTRQRIYKTIDLCSEIWQTRRQEISTSKLNAALQEAIRRTPPSSKSGKEIKIKYITQLSTEPPLFGFFCNNPQLLQDHYKRFLERKLRESFGFLGTPIELKFRKK